MRQRALLVVLLVACNRTEPEPSPKPGPAAATATAPAARGIRFVTPGADADFAKIVRSEADRAKGESRDFLVYVGATWCEPCQRFHDAAKRGELDDAFPSLTILEADADADRERLAAAGYGAEMIPLFAMPSSEGRGTPRRIEGSVKGDRAVANITPRLRQLLGK